MEDDGKLIQSDGLKNGSQSYLDGRKVQCNLYLPIKMRDWLKNQPGGAGKTLIRIIQAEMDKNI